MMTSTKQWSVLQVFGEWLMLVLTSSQAHWQLLGMKATRQLTLDSYSPHPTQYPSPFPRCNRHLLGLGKQIKKSLGDADVIGYQFGTVGVSDGISMGTRGMSFSLQSRDLIADQVETAAGGHWLDGMVVVPGCDKNMPGVLMART